MLTETSRQELSNACQHPRNGNVYNCTAHVNYEAVPNNERQSDYSENTNGNPWRCHSNTISCHCDHPLVKFPKIIVVPHQDQLDDLLFQCLKGDTYVTVSLGIYLVTYVTVRLRTYLVTFALCVDTVLERLSGRNLSFTVAVTLLKTLISVCRHS